MADTRPRAATNGKTINLAQLDTELGGYGLCAGADEVVVAEGSPVTQQQLEDAIAAHTAEIQIDPQAKFLADIDAASTLDELKAAFRATVG